MVHQSLREATQRLAIHGDFPRAQVEPKLQVIIKLKAGTCQEAWYAHLEAGGRREGEPTAQQIRNQA